MSELKNWIDKARVQGQLPEMHDQDTIGEEEARKYMISLRQSFMTGKKVHGHFDRKVLPALLAPLLKHGDPGFDFPLVVDGRDGYVKDLLEFLRKEFDEAFEEGEAIELKERLPEIAKYVRDDFTPEFNIAIESALSETLKNFPYEDENKVFEENCKRLNQHLSAKNRSLLEWSGNAIFHLLDTHLKDQGSRHGAFMVKLKHHIAGLRDILLLHQEGYDSNEPEDHYSFAGDLLSLREIEKVAPTRPSTSMSQLRLDRIRNCLRIVEEGLKSYEEYSSIAFAQRKAIDEFSLSESMYGSKLVSCDGDTIERARVYVESELRNFVELIGAYKIAELELEQKYDEDIHPAYFEAFDFEHLGDSDLGYLRPVIVIDEAANIAGNSGGFMAVIAAGAPVKMLALNRFGDTSSSHGTVPNSHELAAMAIFRRNAYVFQGAMDTPQLVNEAFSKAMHMPVPALMNILVASSDMDGKVAPVLLKAAVESRFFPRVEFDVETGLRFGSHLHVEANTHPEQDFPVFTVDAGSGDERIEYQVGLTMADVFAAIPSNQNKLECIPSGYDSPDLMPLSEYLVQAPGALTGKMPFIWVVDEDNLLTKAIVPLSWVGECRIRLEYWQFLQELGGTNSYHTKRAVEKLREELEEEKNDEIERLHAQLAAESEIARKEDLAEGISRMLQGLMDPDKMKSAPEELRSAFSALTQGKINSAQDVDSSPKVQMGIQGKPAANSKASEIEPMVQSQIPVSSEVWVETDMCTSCSDCIDALPSVFKYNEDKQAVVHNPTGGTYAKIVATAEKCPARCIHPGMPHNPDESGLEKLIKRAEKFN